MTSSVFTHRRPQASGCFSRDQSQLHPWANLVRCGTRGLLRCCRPYYTLFVVHSSARPLHSVPSRCSSGAALTACHPKPTRSPWQSLSVRTARTVKNRHALSCTHQLVMQTPRVCFCTCRCRSTEPALDVVCVCVCFLSINTMHRRTAPLVHSDALQQAWQKES